MRLKLEKPLTEKDFGRTRVIAKFLWLPKKLNYEVRWLEGVLIEQKVTFNLDFDSVAWGDPPIKVHIWQDSKWVDPPINLK